MKKLSSLSMAAAACFTLAGLSSCSHMNCTRGSGNQITQNRPVGTFDRIDVSDSFKVIIKQDSTASAGITVTADDNLIKYIKTVTESGRLRIYIKHNICNSGQMIVNVPVKLLAGVKAADGAEVVTEGKVTAKDMYFKLSDGAKITMDLNAGHVITSESDAAELNLSGQTSSHDIKMSDGSHLNAPQFVTGVSTVQSSDGSNAELNVLTTLNVRSSDGAIVRYHGNPQSVNTDKSDGASVEKVN